MEGPYAATLSNPGRRHTRSTAGKKPAPPLQPLRLPHASVASTRSVQGRTGVGRASVSVRTGSRKAPAIGPAAGPSRQKTGSQHAARSGLGPRADTVRGYSGHTQPLSPRPPETLHRPGDVRGRIGCRKSEGTPPRVRAGRQLGLFGEVSFHLTLISYQFRGRRTSMASRGQSQLASGPSWAHPRYLRARALLPTAA